VDRVLALGKAVRGIVRGKAIEVHLATIAPFLEVKIGKSWPMAYESEDESNAEFHLLKPYNISASSGEPLLPWKSFHDWLRLMLHHFDAIHVLDNYLVNLSSESPSPPIEISIKILQPSHPDGNMLPWKELLKNEKYFPLIPSSPKQPSADELIAFLTSPDLHDDHSAVQELIKDVKRIKRNIESDVTVTLEHRTFQLLRDDVYSLKKTSSAGWKDYVEDIYQQVECLWKNNTKDALLSRLEDISNMLKNLEGSFNLYERVRPKTSLSLGNGFKGASHCEVLAAVLNSLSGTGQRDGLSNDLLKEFETTGQIVGVSKRCFPVCARVLGLLKPNKFDKFFTTGIHTTITACTLPECLPEKIIDQLVLEFGLRLRRELVNLQETATVQRLRARSNDTRRLSMESIVLTERERPNPKISEALV